jgi:endonuclease/exonuclease/phosphatase family metal-dependent hydrolase
MERFIDLAMKKTLFVIICCLAPFCAEAQTLRLMSYNIHHGEGMDEKVDIERIGKLILDVNPEVAGLQEVDSVIARSGNVDIMQLLAEQTGMYASFGYSILHDGGKYGNGILTREKPLAVTKIALPGADEARSALIVELDDYVVVNTHLSLNGGERLESVKIITGAVDAYDKPVFLMGDLNDTPDSEPVTFLQSNWRILTDPGQPTCPSVDPQSTIDYILAYGQKTYAKCEAKVIDDRVASDHRPVFAEIFIRK